MPTRRTVATTLIVLITAFGAGCSGQDDTASGLPRPSRAFCKAAADYDKVIGLKKLPLARHIALTKAIALSAPKDARTEAETVWHAFEQLRAGDRSVVDNPKVQAAVEYVNRRAGQDCGWYQRKGSM